MHKKILIHILLTFLLFSCAKKVNITITSIPDTVVEIENKEYTLPLNIRLIEGNQYEVKAYKKGYETAIVKFAATTDINPINIKMYPSKIKLDINIFPSDSKLEINNKESKPNVLLDYGTHKIKITKNGYKPIRESIKLNVGDEVISKEYKLEPIDFEINEKGLIINKDITLYDSSLNIVSTIDKGKVLLIQRYVSGIDKYLIEIDNKHFYINTNVVMFSTIDLENVTLGVIKKYKIKTNWRKEEYIQEYSNIALIDEVSLKNIDVVKIKDTDEILLESDESGNIIVNINYNDYHTSPVGYTIINIYNDYKLSNLIFRYVKDIGSQDMPRLKLTNFSEDKDQIKVEYKYDELIGIPDYGNGKVSLKYIKNNNSYTLKSYEFVGELDPSLYNNIYPYKGSVISNNYETYAGQFWEINENSYFLPLEGLRTKFSYLIDDYSVIY